MSTNDTSAAAPAAGAPASAPTSLDVLAHLGDVVAQRRAEGDPDKSYVAKLFAKGLDQILKKVGEEATEVVLAAKDADHAKDAPRAADGQPRAADKLVYEVADLWFHSIVALAAFDVRPERVLAELARREGLSGLEEFARRGQKEGA
ncbi:MAG: phosphoribosyl-ATP diphosphatase [Mitsuaria chitosanitabida]|uniref:phosphoribosyl-ATP diphosphatase n=1 Tax=Roseateles chitosanitabidus TaxID=65048 RepID=UPI001B065333|nr:phosphoribosyl-ATP diphosphatase [Roseateles chitosanitabidus]MBO9689540.1 phosphoribosyl-ATP diphosphatase [Roseateles chitosanitabidus]